MRVLRSPKSVHSPNRFWDFQQVLRTFFLHKLPIFQLIFWSGNFLETYNLRVRKLSISSKLLREEIRWNYCILCSVYVPARTKKVLHTSIRSYSSATANKVSVAQKRITGLEKVKLFRRKTFSTMETQTNFCFLSYFGWFIVNDILQIFTLNLFSTNFFFQRFVYNINV